MLLLQRRRRPQLLLKQKLTLLKNEHTRKLRPTLSQLLLPPSSWFILLPLLTSLAPTASA